MSQKEDSPIEDEVVTEIAKRTRELITYINENAPQKYKVGVWNEFQLGVFFKDFGQEGFVVSSFNMEAFPAPEHVESEFAIKML